MSDALMQYSWDILQPIRFSNSQHGTMRITKNGVVSWSEDIHEKMGKPQHVDLVVDRVNHLIGIRPSETGAFRPSRYKGLKSYSISAANTIRHNTNLVLEKAVARMAHNGGGVWYIKIDEWKD